MPRLSGEQVIGYLLNELKTTPCNCSVCHHESKYYCGEDCKCCKITGVCPCQNTNDIEGSL